MGGFTGAFADVMDDDGVLAGARKDARTCGCEIRFLSHISGMFSESAGGCRDCNLVLQPFSWSMFGSNVRSCLGCSRENFGRAPC